MKAGEAGDHHPEENCVCLAVVPLIFINPSMDRPLYSSFSSLNRLFTTTMAVIISSINRTRYVRPVCPSWS